MQNDWYEFQEEKKKPEVMYLRNLSVFKHSSFPNEIILPVLEWKENEIQDPACFHLPQTSLSWKTREISFHVAIWEEKKQYEK